MFVNFFSLWNNERERERFEIFLVGKGYLWSFIKRNKNYEVLFVIVISNFRNYMFLVVYNFLLNIMMFVFFINFIKELL